MASPPIDTAVDWPSPAAVSVEDISVVMPPEREITPTGPGVYAFAASLAGPPMPPILITSGTMIPRQFGPMMRAPRGAASSTIWATSPRGMRSVTITTSFDAVLDRLEHGVLREGRRHGDHRAVDRPAVVLHRLRDGVEDRHAVDVAAEPARA